MIRSTGYLSDVFTEEEIISTNVTTKETKINFLEKLINALGKFCIIGTEIYKFLPYKKISLIYLRKFLMG